MALAALAPDSVLPRLDPPALLGERAALSGLGREGRVSAGGSARLLPAQDGQLVVNLPREDDWSLVPAWLATPSSSRQPGSWQAVAAGVAQGRVASLVDRGRLMGLAVGDAPRRIDSEREWFQIRHASQTPPTGQSETHRLEPPRSDVKTSTANRKDHHRNASQNPVRPLRRTRPLHRQATSGAGNEKRPLQATRRHVDGCEDG